MRNILLAINKIEHDKPMHLEKDICMLMKCTVQ